jgi:hypothetical protein
MGSCITVLASRSGVGFFKVMSRMMIETETTPFPYQIICNIIGKQRVSCSGGVYRSSQPFRSHREQLY